MPPQGQCYLVIDAFEHQGHNKIAGLKVNQYDSDLCEIWWKPICMFSKSWKTCILESQKKSIWCMGVLILGPTDTCKIEGKIIWKHRSLFFHLVQLFLSIGLEKGVVNFSLDVFIPKTVWNWQQYIEINLHFQTGISGQPLGGLGVSTNHTLQQKIH